jgi:hypothetical protein
MFSDSGVEPGGAIAEAFTDIIAPAIRHFQKIFAHLRRLAKLSSRPRFPFRRKQLAEPVPFLVAEARPNEMKQLVNQDETEQALLPEKLFFEHNTALADKAGCIYRRSTQGLPG